MRILTVNAGSSSLKLGVVEEDGSVGSSTELGPPGEATTEQGLERFLHDAGGLDASSHRIVHGGPDMSLPVVVDDAVRATLAATAHLAPLHNPPALAALDVVQARLGSHVPAVACFDTAFHVTIPPEAATFALPAAWNARWGLRRYGFHGLSHQYAAGRMADLLERPLASLKLVTCHLGSGSSLTAVAAGRSVDTTMGFTPVDGLVMGTRPGSVDPGLLVWLLAEERIPLGELSEALEHRSGLTALAGTADMREILDRVAHDEPEATTAFGVHDHRLRTGIAAMAAAMRGIDGLVFTGGIGEHAAPVRRAACAGLGFLGIELDERANENCEPDEVVSTPGGRVPVGVVGAREDLMLAAGARQALAR